MTGIAVLRMLIPLTKHPHKKHCRTAGVFFLALNRLSIGFTSLGCKTKGTLTLFCGRARMKTIGMMPRTAPVDGDASFACAYLIGIPLIWPIMALSEDVLKAFLC